MRFAPFFLFQKPPGRGDDRSILQGELDAIVECEALGYDAAFIAEHVFSPYSLASSPASLLGYLAARTRTLRLGIAVVVVPLSHPLRIAADWATLDVISGGRVELGLGRGYNWFEFDSLGLDLDENTDRFVEGVQVIQGAWTRERMTFHGRFFDIVEAEVLPRPLQQPHPPMFYASSTGESVLMAARAGLGSCASSRPTPAELNARRRAWLEAARAAGHSEEHIQRALRYTPTQRTVWVAETDAQAVREARPLLQSFLDLQAAYGIPGHAYPGRSAPAEHPQYQERLARRGPGGSMTWESLWDNYGVLAGSPATVRSRLKELLDQSPIDYLMLYSSQGGPPVEDLRRSLRLFADKVMPHFK